MNWCLFCIITKVQISKYLSSLRHQLFTELPEVSCISVWSFALKLCVRRKLKDTYALKESSELIYCQLFIILVTPSAKSVHYDHLCTHIFRYGMLYYSYLLVIYGPHNAMKSPKNIVTHVCSFFREE